MTTIDSLIAFWFGEGMKERWFAKDPEFDALVRRKLLPDYEAARDGRLSDWKGSARGCLALCILLDQVPRNVFRDSARAYATDDQAREVTHHALARGFQRQLTQVERLFLYLPLEHSEDLEDQQLCCRLIADLDEDPKRLDYAERHRDIVARFGRFPHRNAALGRPSTAEEQAFLKEPDASF